MDDVGEITPHLQLGDVESLLQQMKCDTRSSMASADGRALISFRNESGVEVTPRFTPAQELFAKEVGPPIAVCTGIDPLPHFLCSAVVVQAHKL